MGGVAIYSKEDLDICPQPVEISQLCEEFICEAAMARIKLKNKYLYILGVYRSPQERAKDAISILSNILENTVMHNNNILILGDINIDNLTPDPESRDFEDELASHNIRRLSLPATRITHTTATSIDCVCTNLPDNDVNTSIIEAGLSDHTAQLCTVNDFTKKAQPLTIFKRNLCKRNLDELKSLLSNLDWENIYNAINVEDAYNNFQRTLTMALDNTCPLKKTMIKNKRKLTKYYDQEARTFKETYIQALMKYEATGNVRDKEEMVARKKDYDLKLRALQRSANKNYIAQSDNKSKALWNLVNTEKQGKNEDRHKIQIETGGKTITDPSEVAEHLNTYFSQVAETTLKQNLDDTNENRDTYLYNSQPEPAVPLLSLLPTNNKEVKTIIDSFKTKSSCGVDEFSSKIVKHCADELIAPLVNIINRSFKCGIFPSALKITKIYPKHKKGPLTDPQNYRPISLISTFSKIIEKVVLNRLMGHLNHQNLLTDNQHGFVKGKSTTSAVISLLDHVIEQVDKGNFTTAVLLDYSKAFDCLGHELILTKLEALGVLSTANKWIKSYLEGRTQLVEIQDTRNGSTTSYRSKPQEITRGVPQGSVLGPVLFILLTNDFPRYIHDNNTESLMYADDTTILLKSTSAADLRTNTLAIMKKAQEYCLANDLVMNPSKTTQLQFSKKKEHVQDIPDITVKQHTKFLGLIIDNKLNWNEHINSTCKKINTGLYVMRRIKWIGDIKIAKTAYFALVEAHIRYGLIAWGGTSAGNLQRILLVQKKAVRVLADLEYWQSCRDAFRNLKIMTVVALYIHEVILYADRLSLPRGEDTHLYNTRHGSKYVLPIHRTAFFENKPSYIGRKLHNLLPQELRELSGIRLKNTLRTWLTDRPIYTLKEFFDITSAS